MADRTTEIMKQMRDLRARGEDPAGYTYDGPPGAYAASAGPPGAYAVPGGPSFLDRLGGVIAAGKAAFAPPAGPSDPSMPPASGDEYDMEAWLRGLPDRAAPNVGVSASAAPRVGVAPAAAAAPDADPMAAHYRSLLDEARRPFPAAAYTRGGFYADDLRDREVAHEQGRLGRESGVLKMMGDYQVGRAEAGARATQAQAQQTMADVELKKFNEASAPGFQDRQFAREAIGNNASLLADPRFARMARLPADPLDVPGAPGTFVPGAAAPAFDDFLKSQEMVGAAPYEPGTDRYKALATRYSPELKEAMTGNRGLLGSIADEFQDTGNMLWGAVGGTRYLTPFQARQARLKRMIGVRGGAPRVGIQP